MKQVIPLYGGSAFGSLFISTNTTLDKSPLVTHIFWPFRIQSSPSLVATDLIPWTSEPTSGSESENAARSSPVAIFGRKYSFCSSVPNFISRYEPMKCVLTTPEIEIQPRESYSTIIG